MQWPDETTTGRLLECYNDLTMLTVLCGVSWEDITNCAIDFARGVEYAAR